MSDFERMCRRYSDENEPDQDDEARWADWPVRAAHSEWVAFTQPGDRVATPADRGNGNPDGLGLCRVGELFDAVEDAARAYARAVADHRTTRQAGYRLGMETLERETDRRVRAYNRLCRLIYQLEQV
ncbi:MAG: hypothetical protein ACOC7S_00755 [Planctomycetota bacterium]